MQTWISTDWHKDHANIITYENRPDNFAELLVARHNELMAPNDTLLCLGDVIFGDNKDSLGDYLSRFKCRTKVLILGNHDKMSPEWYLDQGFSMVCQQIVLKSILFSHAPAMIGKDHALNVHGHFHRNLHRDKERHWYPKSSRHVLLSCEFTDYYPISLGDLRNGRFTYNGTVYFRKGYTNGFDARNSFLATEGSPESPGW